MKTIITVLFFVLMSPILDAQHVFDEKTPLFKDVKEEYLVSLLKECKLVYCDRDTIGDMLFIKKMEVEFFDTTMFFAAYLSSSPFTKTLYEYGMYECDFIQIDDGGYGVDLDEKALKNLPYFKAVLDALIRQTPFVQYTGNCPGTD